MTNEEKAWTKGYACAVAMLIRKNEIVTTEAKELFNEGLSWEDMKIIDPSDRSTFEGYKEDLITT